MKNSKTLTALLFAILTTGILVVSATLIPEKTLAHSPGSKQQYVSTQSNGKFMGSIQSLPEENIFTAMAVREANGKGPVDSEDGVLWGQPLKVKFARISMVGNFSRSLDI